MTPYIVTSLPESISLTKIRSKRPELGPRAGAVAFGEEVHDVGHVGEGLAVRPAVVDAVAPLYEDGEAPGVLFDGGIAALAEDGSQSAVPGALEAEEV